MSIYAPADDNAIIRREGAAPWHEKLGEQMRRADIASLATSRVRVSATDLDRVGVSEIVETRPHVYTRWVCGTAGATGRAS